ncbi:MAG: nucleotidyltransferase domain-containing protein [Actinobacteria bacterium]|nr:MAG: nucleotidyltransferase domain-containing protein [Actinomycetota bacterium]
MTDASARLQALARELAAYVEHCKPRAILLTGSAATGAADLYSDLDLIVYHDELPPATAFGAARDAVGAVEAGVFAPPTNTEYPELYTWHGVQCQVAHQTIKAWEADLRTVLVDVDVESSLQKAISGLYEGIGLHGEDLIERWRDETRYPDELARAMVERHWRFLPIWHVQARLSTRDAALWSRQVLVESAFALLGVLAGLNRLWFTSFQFKRAREFVAQMTIAPSNLADRLEALVSLEIATAIAELEALVAETQALLVEHMPDFDASLRRGPGTREIPWKLAT